MWIFTWEFTTKGLFVRIGPPDKWQKNTRQKKNKQQCAAALAAQRDHMTEPVARTVGGKKNERRSRRKRKSCTMVRRRGGSDDGNIGSQIHQTSWVKKTTNWNNTREPAWSCHKHTMMMMMMMMRKDMHNARQHNPIPPARPPARCSVDVRHIGGLTCDVTPRLLTTWTIFGCGSTTKFHRWLFRWTWRRRGTWTRFLTTLNEFLCHGMESSIDIGRCFRRCL